MSGLTNPVTTEAALNADLVTLASKTSGSFTIDLGANITLSSDLEAINLEGGVTLTLNGEGDTLNGGGDHRGLFVFSYLLQPQVQIPDDTEDLWHWHGRRYLFRAIPVDEYRRHMRLRSPKWGTVDLPRRAFRQLVRPLQVYVHAARVVEEEAPF